MAKDQMRLRQTAVNKRCPKCNGFANVYMVGREADGCHLHVRICWNGCGAITGRVHLLRKGEVTRGPTALRPD